MIDLPEKTVLIVGVGGADGEASKLCAALGMRVLGIDPRVTEPPVGMSDLATPDRLEEHLGDADFVILTTPETPDTVGMFNTRLFARMKRDVLMQNIRTEVRLTLRRREMDSNHWYLQHKLPLREGHLSPP